MPENLDLVRSIEHLPMGQVGRGGQSAGGVERCPGRQVRSYGETE
jgi:hypothetical protein